MYVTSLFVRPQVGNNLNILQWMNGEINCGVSYYVIPVNSETVIKIVTHAALQMNLQNMLSDKSYF